MDGFLPVHPRQPGYDCPEVRRNIISTVIHAPSPQSVRMAIATAIRLRVKNEDSWIWDTSFMASSCKRTFRGEGGPADQGKEQRFGASRLPGDVTAIQIGRAQAHCTPIRTRWPVISL